jgi:hypothetical protein
MIFFINILLSQSEPIIFILLLPGGKYKINVSLCQVKIISTKTATNIGANLDFTKVPDPD